MSPSSNRPLMPSRPSGGSGSSPSGLVLILTLFVMLGGLVGLFYLL